MELIKETRDMKVFQEEKDGIVYLYTMTDEGKTIWKNIIKNSAFPTCFCLTKLRLLRNGQEILCIEGTMASIPPRGPIKDYYDAFSMIEMKGDDGWNTRIIRFKDGKVTADDIDIYLEEIGSRIYEKDNNDRFTRSDVKNGEIYTGLLADTTIIADFIRMDGILGELIKPKGKSRVKRI